VGLSEVSELVESEVVRRGGGDGGGSGGENEPKSTIDAVDVEFKLRSHAQ